MLLEIEKVRCLPFKVTSYEKSVYQLLEILEKSGIVVYNNITLEEITRYKYNYRFINPLVFKKNGYPLVHNLIDQPLYNIYFWDIDAMCQIAIDVKRSDVKSKDRYVSLIPTFNGKAGMAVCTIARYNETVEFGLYRSDVCEVIYQSSNHPINGDVIVFS